MNKRFALITLAVSVIFFALYGFGEWFDVFYIVPWFDFLMHALGGLWVGLVIVFFLGRQPFWFLILIVIVVGGLWELLEFLLDHFAGFPVFGTPIDTAMDFVADTLGGIVAYFFMRKFVTIKR